MPRRGRPSSPGRSSSNTTFCSRSRRSRSRKRPSSCTRPTRPGRSKASTTGGCRRAWQRSSSCCRDVTRNRKSERALSKQSANLALLQHGSLAVLCVLVVAACGSSTPRQAAVEEPKTVITPDVREAGLTAAPVEAGEPPRRNARRAEREAAELTAKAAGAGASEPIPEAALAGYDRALAAIRADD